MSPLSVPFLNVGVNMKAHWARNIGILGTYFNHCILYPTKTFSCITQRPRRMQSVDYHSLSTMGSGSTTLPTPPISPASAPSAQAGNKPAKHSEETTLTSEYYVESGTVVDSDMPDTIHSTESLHLRLGFLILGIGSLLPFNALLSVLDYYKLQYAGYPIEQLVSNTYTIPFMLSGMFLTFNPPSSTRVRTYCIIASYLSLTVLSLLYSAFDALSSVLVFTALLGVVNALDQSMLFGLLSRFSSRLNYMKFYNIGGAVASLLLICLRIMTRIAFHSVESDGVNSNENELRFGFSIFFMICSFLSFLCTIIITLMYFKSGQFSKQVTYNTDNGDIINNGDNSERLSFSELKQIFQYIYKDCISMFMNFFLTLSLFPGISVNLPLSIRDNDLISPQAASWYPLYIVFIFAVGDTLGRIFFTNYFSYYYSSYLLPLTVVRFGVIYPLFIYIWSAKHLLFQLNPSSIFVLLFVLSFTNGFIVNVCFIAAPMKIPSNNNRFKEQVGRIMFLMLNFGLCFGTILGWITQSYMTHFLGF